MRYFVVFYVGEGVNGGKSVGNAAIESEKYPNRDYVVKWIPTKAYVRNVIITNIIELSKEDFDEFKR